MSHLVLFFLISNLTHVCSEICFGEGSYCAGTIQLICGANHLTGSCMVRVFAGGCFRADFCCLIFCKYRFYHWFNLNVTELLKSSIVFYLSIHADRCCFVASKSRYFYCIQISNSSKIKYEKSIAIFEDISVFH